METKVNELELNKKLAEWAGINSIPMEKIYYDHTTEIFEELPDFTQSLDACFKWLVPKLDYVEIKMNVAPSGDVFWNAHIEAEYKKSVTSETPALALCYAIEKLIDSEVR